jgi:5-methylcytosine-specific restriction endonuclease McrA
VRPPEHIGLERDDIFETIVEKVNFHLYTRQCKALSDVIKSELDSISTTDARPKWQISDRTPLAAGGSNAPSNLQGLCPTCNGRKGAKDPIDFARSMGKLL